MVSYLLQPVTDILYYKARYISWCEKNDFESKLPKVVKARKAAQEAEDRSKQSSLNLHLKERPTTETSIPYSDSLFREATIEWLIATDQVSFRDLMFICIT